MRAMERRELLLHQVHDRGYLSAADAAAELGVDTSTIRRDLTELERLGLLRRSHGGALPRHDEADVPMGIKVTTLVDQKRAIAQRVADLIPAGASVILDAGSTSLMVAKALDRHTELTVLTPDVWIAAELIVHPHIHLIVPGGQNILHTTTLISQEAIEIVERHHVDIAVICVDAVDVHKATNSNGAIVAMKQAMMRAAARTLLVVDSSKFDQRRLLEVAPTEAFGEIVTDDGVTERVVRDYPVQFHIADTSTARERDQ